MGWIIGTLVVVLALVWFLLIGPHNQLVRQRNTVQEAWRQVDVELNRRSDLIPNLVNTVKGYATHEHNTLEDIVALRNQARSLSTTNGVPSQARADVEQQLSAAVSQFLVTVEAYPELKANVNFQELQRELVETEDRISNGRRYYNAVVSDYNTRVESFPSNLVANMFGFQRAGFFEVTDPAVLASPKVSFDQIDYRGSAPQDVTPDQPPAVTQGGVDNPVTWQQPTPQPEQAPAVRPDQQFGGQTNPGQGGTTQV